MSSESPPAKRRRTGESAPITRSKVWIDDGNVILQAKDTQFRVHWSSLARHSAIFHDMRALPQPPEEPKVDGCPVVHLPDDPTDVEYLLNALYDPYTFKDVLDLAVQRLMDECPTTLEEYDAMRTRTFDVIEYYDGIEFDRIILLSENKILSALPCAYYRAVQQSRVDDLLERVDRGDGTFAFLSGTDLRACLNGLHLLSHKQFEPGYTLGWAREWNFDDDHCNSPKACRLAREHPLAYCCMGGYRVQAVPVIDPTHGGLWMFHPLCAACARHAKDSIAAGRKKIWQELPKMFDLPPWSELKNGL
ncbi:hypothetical protein C8R45DRAFT_918130 [Mycena sanguinolenta]|nr:hypothetical protein C8R45DRAFT_918130 [Mycena sanguinolenta]